MPIHFWHLTYENQHHWNDSLPLFQDEWYVTSRSIRSTMEGSSFNCHCGDQRWSEAHGQTSVRENEMFKLTEHFAAPVVPFLKHFFCACSKNWLISQRPIQLLLNFIISQVMYKISNLLIRPSCSTIRYIFNYTEAAQLPLSIYLATHLCNCLLTYQIVYNYVSRQLELGCRPASIPSVLLESCNASELQSDGDGGILRFQFFVTCWLYHSRSRSTIQGLHMQVNVISVAKMSKYIIM